jgi:hypothetical protein
MMTPFAQLYYNVLYLPLDGLSTDVYKGRREAGITPCSLFFFTTYSTNVTRLIFFRKYQQAEVAGYLMIILSNVTVPLPITSWLSMVV